MLPFADWQAVLQGEMSPNNRLASSEHYAGNLHKYSVIKPNIEDMTAIDPSQIETASVIWLGESAGSPWEGSISDP
jgi:hypothetical protein